MAQANESLLEGFIFGCADVSKAEGLWNDAQDFFENFGATRSIYVHLPTVRGAENEGVEVLGQGCEAHSVRHYTSREFYREDPLIARGLREGDPLSWGDIRRLKGDNDGQREVLGFYGGAGFRSGISLPVFGPGGRNGCVTLGFERDAGPRSKDAAVEGTGVARLQAACQAAHIRHCKLRRAEEPELPRLSPRERELLTWVARGKSNGVIAEIMQISPHTVDAYMRRVFLKLGTTDRISAALRGLAEGVITG